MKRTFIALTSIIWVMLLISITFPAFSGDDMPKDAYEMSEEESLKSGIRPLRLENQTVMPRHDGRHYFIDDGRSVLPSATDEVSTLAIDKAVQNPGQVVEISDLASFIAGGWQDVLNFKQLPLVVKFTGELQDLNTQLVITSIIFSKSEIKAQIGVLTKMPETPTLSSSSGEANRLYFGASFILRKGGSLDGSLILIAPREINLMSLNGIGKLALTTGTGVCLGCSASKNKNPNAFKLNLEGEFVFDPSFIVAENSEGNAFTGDNRVAKALFSTTITGWSSFRFNLVLPSSYGLQVASFPYLGFWSSVNHTAPPVTTDLCTPPQSVSGNITIDFSETGTPIGNGSNAKGVIFQDFKIRLPKQLKKKGDIAAPYVNLTYLYFDEEGDLSALASSNTKFGAGIGDGFSLEINNTLVKIDSGALVEFSVAGDLETPIMQGKEMTFLLANKKEISGDTRLNFTTGMKSGKNEANLNLFGLAKITPQPSSSGNNKKFVEASGGINLTTGNLESFGLGFYHGQFTITKSLTHLTFLYDEIVLSSQYPYLTSFTLTPDSSKALTIAGFSLTLSSLRIKAETSGDISGYVNITGGLEFGSASNQSITASAGLAFKASTITQEGKHKFKLDKFSLDKIGVAANFPTFGFDAFLNIFDNESRLGVNNLTGFEGKGRFWFSFLSKTDGAKMQGTQDTTKASSGKAGAGVYLLFAKNATGKVAWAIDLDLNFGETGIPLGTVNMKGIYGGAYSNLKIKGDPIAKVSNKGSRTGLSYQWEDGTWGFNLGLDLTAAGNIDVSAMLAVQGRLGKGLQYIKAAGYARFQLNTVTDKVPNVGSKMGSSYAQIADKTDKVSENTALISKDDLKRAQSDEKNAKGTDNGSKSLAGLFGSPSGSENKLAAGIIIAYNFGDEQTEASLSVKMYPDIYINFSTGLSNTTLETTGYGMLYLSSSTKYLHLGKATSINDRLGLKLSATSSALKVKAFVNAYFMLGDELATSVPDPIVPDDFAALFAEQKDDLGNINKVNASDDALKSGSGIAFGVAVGINIDMNFLGVVAVNANAGGGFDALIKKIECKEGWVSASSGLGWNAEAQLYGYASATASVLGIEVLSAGIGFLIKAKFPQPFYAEGTFVAYVKVWKAKASIRVHAKVGDPSDCLPDTSMPNIVYNWNFVQSIAPSGSVSPVGNFQVTCVYPKDQIKTSDRTKYLQALEVVYLMQGETIAGNWTYNTVNNPTKYQKVGINPIPSVNSGLVVPLLRKELAKNTKYTAKVRIYIYDLNNNNQIVEVEDKDGIKTRLEQYYSYDFETNDQDWTLTEFDVLAYPAKNQYNTYLKDYNGNGYFNVESTLSNAIAQKCSGCIFELGLYENNTPIKSYPLASIATDKDFSLSDLKKDKIYQIKVTYSKEGKTQNLYDTHYFRTSTFDTWSEKLDAYKKNMNPSWSNEDFGFDISMDESIDETFSADEKKVMNGEALFNTPENWFYYIKNGAGKQNYGTMPPSGYGGATGNNTKSDGSGSITGIKIVEYPPVSPLNLGFQQAKYPLLNNDEIDNETNSQTNIKGPIFQIKNFENFITTYRNTNIAYNYIANPASELWLPRGTYSNSKLCFKWLFPINKLDYYQNRVWGQLPSIYDNTNSSNICFFTPQNINFNDFLIFQRRIKVYCKRQLRDSQGILFAFDLQSKNGTSIPFPEGLKISLKNNSTNPATFDDFSEVKFSQGADTLYFASTRRSELECPNSSDFRLIQGAESASGYQYALEIIPLSRPVIKPCLTIRKDPDAQNDYLEKLCGDKCAKNSDGSYKSQNACLACRESMKGADISHYYKIESWESDLKLGSQAVPSTFNLTLSNQKTVTFNQDEKSVSVMLTEQELQKLGKDQLTIIKTIDSPFICGDFITGERYNIARFNGKGDSQVKACGSSEETIAYTEANPDTPQEGASTFYEETQPLKKTLSLTYYTLGEGINRKWYGFKNGVYQTSNYCIVTPVVEIKCNLFKDICPFPNIYSYCDYPNYSFNFFADEGKTKVMIPWNVPDNGYSFTMNNGSIISFTKSELIGKSSVTFKTKAGEACSTLKSSNIPSSEPRIISPPKYDCTTKPTKPVLTASKTSVGFGETITLTASGGNNSYHWFDESTNATKTAVINGKSTFTVYSIDKITSCLSEPTSIDINVAEVAISASKNKVCTGDTTTLTAQNCSGAIKWSSNDATINLGTSHSVKVKINTAVTFTLECTLSSGTSRTATIEIAHYPLPTAPTIAQKSGESNTLCLGEKVNLLVQGVCAPPANLEWSNGSVVSILSETPAQTTTYYAICKNDACASAQSNNITVTVIAPPKALIMSSLENNIICKNGALSLSVNNCSVDQEVEWFKNNQSTSFAKGVSITLKLQEKTSIKARCIQKVSLGTVQKNCSGDFSESIDINVVGQDEMDINLAISKARICTNDSAILNVTGCKVGVVEWKDSSENWVVGTRNRVVRMEGLYQVRCNLNNVCFNKEHGSGVEISQKLEVMTLPQAPVLGADPATTICQGESITLKGICNQGVLEWNKLGELSVNPQVNTSYTAFCQTTEGCRSANESKLDIVVNPIPQKPFIGNSLNRSIVATFEQFAVTASCENGSVVWENAPQKDFTPWNAGEYVLKAKCVYNNCSSSWNTYKLTVRERPAKPSITASAMEVCAPTSITLTATGCAQKTIWSNGEIGNSIVLNKEASFAIKAQCIEDNIESIESNELTLRIKEKPEPPYLAARDICEGQPTNVEIVFNSAGGASLQWLSEAPKANGIAGNYTYTAMVSRDGCQSDSRSVSQRVISYPSPLSISENAECGSTLLTVNGGNGNFTWSNGQQGNTLRVNNTGIYTVSSTNEMCGVSANLSVGKIRQTPEPPYLAARDICEGQPTNVEVQFDATGGASLQWLSNSAPQANGVVGNYTYTAVVSRDGCQSDSRSVNQRVIPYPSPITIAENSECGSTTLTANGGNGNYTWSNGHQGKVLSISNTGEFTVSSANEICGVSAKVSINVIRQVADMPIVSVMGSIQDGGAYKVCGNQTTLKSNIPSNWYAGDQLLATSQTSIVLGSNQTLVVKGVNDGCESPSSVELTVAFINGVMPESIREIQYCGYTELQSSCSAGYVQWYRSTSPNIQIDTPGFLESLPKVGTGNTLRIENPNTAFIAQCINDFCSGKLLRSIYISSIKPAPIPVSLTPITDNTSNRCGEWSLELMASIPQNIQWNSGNGWYDGGQTQTFHVSNSMNISVRYANNGCIGSEQSFAVTYNRTPSAPTVWVGKNNDCGYTLNASSNEGSIVWWKNTNTHISNSASINVPNPVSGERYFASTQLGSCFSTLQEASVAPRNCAPLWVTISSPCENQGYDRICYDVQEDQNPESITFKKVEKRETRRCSLVPQQKINSSKTYIQLLVPDDCKTSTIKWTDLSTQTIIGTAMWWVEGNFANKPIKVECENQCGTISSSTFYH